jgi:hypothetical protein
MATINMLVGQKATLAIIKTKNSLDAELVGTPTWTTGNPALVGLNPAPDGLTCEISAKGTGSTTVTANAQGAGALSANHTVTITADNLATALALTLEKPPE